MVHGSSSAQVVGWRSSHHHGGSRHSIRWHGRSRMGRLRFFFLFWMAKFWGSFSQGLRSLFSGLGVTNITPGVALFLEEAASVLSHMVHNGLRNTRLVTALGSNVQGLIALDKLTILDVASMVVGFSAAAT